MTSSETDLPVLEYQEINAHLRTNTTAFVNWFSFFLTFSLAAALAFLVAGEHRQGLRGLTLRYGVPIACLMLHVIALAGILVFRHYVTAAHRKLDETVKLLGDTCGSPFPVRFTLWTTHWMAAGIVVSYFAWFALLLLPRDRWQSTFLSFAPNTQADGRILVRSPDCPDRNGLEQIRKLG